MKRSPHPAVDEWLVYLKAQGKSNSTTTHVDQKEPGLSHVLALRVDHVVEGKPIRRNEGRW